MRILNVQLIKKAVDALSDVADEFDMDVEEAFEYVVRNTLKMYHVIEFTGYIRLIDELGYITVLRVRSDDESSLIKRIVSKLCGKPKRQVVLASESFSTIVEDEFAEAVEMQADLFGLTDTDFYNRLITIGCTLAIELKHEDHRAFGFSHDGHALGRIVFERR